MRVTSSLVRKSITRTLVPFTKKLSPIFALLLISCANPYNRFYSGITDARQQAGYELEQSNLQIYKTDNFERDRFALMQRGYQLLGSASFNAPSNPVTEEHLQEQAQKIGAQAVLISSKYSHTISGAISLVIPQTMTTYGSQTALIPYSVGYSDFTTLFFAKYRSRVGIVAETIDDETRKRLQSNQGVKVRVVVEGSTAFKADILPGDIILGVGGNTVQSVEKFSHLMRKFEGQTVRFRLDRDGKIIDKSVFVQILTKGNDQNSLQPVPVVTNSEAAEWTTRSLQSLHDKQWTEAIRAASIAISLDPTAIAPYINRAWAYAEQGFYEKAISDCNAAIKIDPNESIALNNRGLSYQRMGQKENAIRDYRQACEMQMEIACTNFKDLVGYLPTEAASVLLRKSEQSFSVGDYKSVISLSEQALALQPNTANSAEAYSNKCAAEAFLGRLKEGKSSCQKSIKIAPNFSMAYNNLGFILEKEKNNAEASLYYEMACGQGNEMGCQNQKRLGAVK